MRETMRKIAGPPNPSGMCMCGCGRQTPLAKTTQTQRGRVEGEPMRFCKGHGLKGKRGSDVPSWKGGRYENSAGYIYAFTPDHPAASKYGYVLEHRLVVERTLGRYLTRGESVHHINGIKDDNRPENLQAMTKREHGLLHNAAYFRKFEATLDPNDLTARRRAAGRKGAAKRWEPTREQA
jgi:hypothetical protein